MAEKLRGTVEAVAIPNEASDAADRVTVSVGAATLRPSHDASPESLVEAADQQL